MIFQRSATGLPMAELVCPTCRKKVAFTDLAEVPYRPFCSRRCKLIDLGKWLNEEYRISEPADDTVGPLPPPPSQTDPDRQGG